MGDHKNVEVPPFFVCPISLEIMKDPVTLPTGITYDRDSIEKWLYTKKNNTCPVTKQVLLDVELIPNHTVHRLIQSWCTLNPLSGVKRLPTSRLPVSKSLILKLLKDLKYPNLQIQSLKKLKAIVLENESNKRSMEAVGAVNYLCNYVLNDHNNNVISSSSPTHEDCDIEGFELVTPSDEAISILYHMNLSQTGLHGLFTTCDIVETVTRITQQPTNYETRTYALLLFKSLFEVADAQFSSSVTMSLKHEFFTELVKILTDQMSQNDTKAALTLLIHVCSSSGRNRIKAAEAGTVTVLVNMLLDSSDKRISEMVLLALDQLCQCAEGRSELLKHGAGLAVVSKKIFRVSPVASDRAVRIVHSVAKFSGNGGVVAEMLQIGVVGKLCLVLQVECGSKMKEKAMEVLKMHARVWNNSGCIPRTLVSSYPS